MQTEQGSLSNEPNPLADLVEKQNALQNDPKPPLLPRKKKSNLKRSEFTIRHSSYSGGLLSKIGKSYFYNNQNSGNPIIVFDTHSSDADEIAPIELNVRQPSFVSLHPGVIIPKGSDSISNFMPCIEEVEPLPTPDIKSSGHGADEDQQTMIAKELQAKHQKMWKSIGYEPPNDLIPRERANNNDTNLDKDKKKRKKVKNMKIRRSMSSDYLDFQSISKANPKGLEEEEEEEKSSDGELFGRLNEIVTEPADSPLFQTLKTGAVDMNNPKIHDIYKRLVHYAKLTEHSSWVEENSYLNEIINAIDTSSSSKVKKSKKTKKEKKSKHEERKQKKNHKIDEESSRKKND